MERHNHGVPEIFMTACLPHRATRFWSTFFTSRNRRRIASYLRGPSDSRLPQLLLRVVNTDSGQIFAMLPCLSALFRPRNGVNGELIWPQACYVWRLPKHLQHAAAGTVRTKLEWLKEYETCNCSIKLWCSIFQGTIDRGSFGNLINGNSFQLGAMVSFTIIRWIWMSVLCKGNGDKSTVVFLWIPCLPSNLTI